MAKWGIVRLQSQEEEKGHEEGRFFPPLTTLAGVKEAKDGVAEITSQGGL